VIATPWGGLGVALAVTVSLGCVGPKNGLVPPAADEPVTSVYVVNHNDWHTGIVVRRTDIPDDLWPEQRDFHGFNYVEVGWGDRDYYQASAPTWWITLKAAFWPSRSVLHVVGLDHPVALSFPGSEMIEIGLSSRGAEQLAAFIHESYKRDESGRSVSAGPGRYAHSRFYPARGVFHLFKTCNTWTAHAMRAAGCPVTPWYAITAGNLMRQAKHCRQVARRESDACPRCLEAIDDDTMAGQGDAGPPAVSVKRDSG
jgi:uncharacterized protein (TIGR02117 family)